MKNAQENMPQLIPVLEKDLIAEKVAGIAGKISADYADGDLILVGVLKGAFVFLSDLARQLSIPSQIDFIRVASYGAGSCSSGTISLSKDLEMDIEGKDVLIVEDIIDTGLTIRCLIDHLKSSRPRSVRVCTLIDKTERREIQFDPDYACHKVESGFLVGYGLDYAEDYRHLPGIYHLKL
jgi:hypoxanthine phosphoribosyltransferase